MKRLRIIGFLFSLGVVLAALIAPADMQALVPVSVHDFFVGPESVSLGMATVSLASFSRKDRQKANLGGIAKLYLFGASDFTADWPLKADITAGAITSTTIPLKTGVVASVLTFDIGTCRIKSEKKGKLGYQNVAHSGECKFAGYDAVQMVALETTFNEGGVAIAVYKDGTRVVLGTSYEPLEFTDSTDSGAKADDQLAIDFKFTGDGYAWHPPTLALAVTIALPVVA